MRAIWLFPLNVVDCFCSTISAYSIIGDWHHLTFLWWDKIYWALFIDGVNSFQETQYDWFRVEDYVLKGTLRIGQSQNPTNPPSPSFIGQITSFNMWDYKMDNAQIALLVQSCMNTPGNMFQWSTFGDKVQGGLKLVKPSTCK